MPNASIDPASPSRPEDRVVEVPHLYERRISLFNTVRSKQPPREIRIRELLNEVESGRWRAEVGLVRLAKSEKQCEMLKLRLPAVKLSGTFRGQRAADLIQLSELLCVDLDDVGIKIPAVRKILQQDRHVLAYFVSPTGHGIKVIVPIVAANEDEHKACTVQALAHFRTLVPSTVKVDPAPTNVTANCFVSYDPMLWRSAKPRLAFEVGPNGAEKGGDIDFIPEIESNEKESSPPSPPVEEDGGSVPWTPPPAPIRITGFLATDSYPRWVAHVRHKPASRNKVIVDKTPILLNVAGELQTALMLLRWFDEAPVGMFSATRVDHWKEIRAAIQGCLAGYSSNAKVGLSPREREVYHSLRDNRRRAAFRICRSLSRAKANERGTFAMSDGQLGDRLGCRCALAARQLRRLVRDGILQKIESGKKWAIGQKATATRYRWALR